MIQTSSASRPDMSGSRNVGPALVYLGLLGFMLTIWMALIEAPSMGDDWNEPPSDWVGAVIKKREDNVAKMAPRVKSSEFAPSLMSIASGRSAMTVRSTPSAPW